jgi:L(+)-tartrate dehydratase beta subunit
LTKIGICGNILKDKIVKVHNVYFLDELGKTEATWIFEVKDFGPFFVDIDSSGNNYFEQINGEIESKMPGIYAKFGINEDYDYTKVTP